VEIHALRNVTSTEAKKILLLYRPETADAESAEFSEALEMTARDAELARWFENQCNTQRALRRCFEAIAVPAALKEQIISEHRAEQTRRRMRRAAGAVAAAVCAALVLAGVWLLQTPPDDRSLPAFGRRMIKTAKKTYRMDVETNDVATIRSYLATKQSPADYVLPKALEAVQLTGCAALLWQDQPVSMICFRTGRPLGPGEKSDLFLFVVDRSAVADGPRSSQPTFIQQNRMATATWVEGEKLYFLTGNGDEAFLRSFL
jgi:hypothetical protein